MDEELSTRPQHLRRILTAAMIFACILSAKTAAVAQTLTTNVASVIDSEYTVYDLNGNPVTSSDSDGEISTNGSLTATHQGVMHPLVEESMVQAVFNLDTVGGKFQSSLDVDLRLDGYIWARHQLSVLSHS